MNVVFHHTTDEPAMHDRVCNNIANLLDDDTVSVANVVLVANSGGLTLLRTGSPQAERIAALAARGVTFRQCRNTLRAAGVDESVLLDDTEIVSSGVGHVVQLQADG